MDWEDTGAVKGDNKIEKKVFTKGGRFFLVEKIFRKKGGVQSAEKKEVFNLQNPGDAVRKKHLHEKKEKGTRVVKGGDGKNAHGERPRPVERT